MLKINSVSVEKYISNFDQTDIVKKPKTEIIDIKDCNYDTFKIKRKHFSCNHTHVIFT